VEPSRIAATDDDDLVILLVRTAKAVVDRLRSQHPEGASSPMTVVHGLAARYLVGRDDVTAVELSRYLGITKQSTSEVVALLEGAGIIRRAPHPTDGRARVLLLTDEGAAKLALGRCRWTEIEAEWTELVGAESMESMRAALTTFLAADTKTRDAQQSPG
jgi:DNA-binding MarR family transcriptional regulator